MNLTFSSAPGAADRTLQFRPRARNANATQEVAVDDILEVLDRVSVDPLPEADVTQMLPRARRNLRWLAGLVVTGAALILMAAMLPGVMNRWPARQGSVRGATKLVLEAPAVAAAQPVAAPTVRVEDLPRAPAQTGTLRLARASAGHRVFLDGVLLTAAAAQVACGSHLIKVGSQGRPQRIDVPCGGELALLH